MGCRAQRPVTLGHFTRSSILRLTDPTALNHKRTVPLGLQQIHIQLLCDIECKLYLCVYTSRFCTNVYVSVNLCGTRPFLQMRCDAFSERVHFLI